jgi:hypothetical protein
MRTLPALAHLAWISALGSCASVQTTYVESKDSALGKVVVYRNGVAYYERRAKPTDGVVELTVPSDKVNDFLKSLTMLDTKTKKALPIAYPTVDATEDAWVTMKIRVPAGTGEVVLTYITSAPAWKPTYRVVVKEGGKVGVQGWAIVDNTSGEDWKEVEVGVGSSSAMSFRYDLRSVLSVFREELEQDRRFAVAPPTGGSTFRENEGERVVAVLTDDEIPRGAGHPDGGGVDVPMEVSSRGERPRETDSSSPATTVRGGPSREPETKQAAGRDKVAKLAQDLNRKRGDVIIEGFGDAKDDDATKRGFDRANEMKNRLVEEGVAPGRIKVVSKGKVEGNQKGVQLVLAEPAKQATGALSTPANEDPVGESHFQSEGPITVTRGTSAMVAVLDQDTPGEIVYLYDAESDRGNQRFAFKAVRFKNPSGSMLEGGPVTVYGDARFVGEGLTQSIPPASNAVVPFALDRQVVVDREGSTGDEISQLLSLQRGVLTAEVKHTKKTNLKITNRSHLPTAVMVRHTVQKGWELAASPKVYERLDASYLFEIAIGAGKTETVEILEATPLIRTVDLRSTYGLGLVRVYLGMPRGDTALEDRMKQLFGLHDEIANHEEQIETIRRRMDEYRDRMNELERQIVTLAGVKRAGPLMKHLQTKLKEMSDRVQRSTIQVVDHEQQLMLARVKFADGVSELTLERQVTKGT